MLEPIVYTAYMGSTMLVFSIFLVYNLNIIAYNSDN